MTDATNTEKVTARTAKKWGLIALLLSLPIGTGVSHFVDPERGMAAGISSGLLIVAIRAFWYLRRQPWFWMTVAVLTIMHSVLVLVVPWPNKGLSSPALWPIGIADFAAICGCVKLVEKLMSRGARTGSFT
jgi:hypothetical protein